MFQHCPETDQSSLGALLSIEIDCAVRLSDINRKSFVCRHGIIFPFQYVQYAASTKDWSWIRKKHNVKEAW